MKKCTLLTIIFLSVTFPSIGQNVELDKYDIYISDTLIATSDFIQNSQSLSPDKAKTIEFKPKSDGIKLYYYINGKIQSKGEIKNGMQEGYWEYWHSNGVKAREGDFKQGKANGRHRYWYDNGNPRGTGNWKDGEYHGKWEMYSEDGNEKIVQEYKNGILVEE